MTQWPINIIVKTVVSLACMQAAKMIRTSDYMYMLEVHKGK